MAPLTSPVGSIDVLASRHLPDRPQQNEKIQAEAPVGDVPAVILDTALDRLQGRCRAPVVVHLRPAGDAGLHVVAVGVILDLLDEFVVVADRKIARFLRSFG